MKFFSNEVQLNGLFFIFSPAISENWTVYLPRGVRCKWSSHHMLILWQSQALWNSFITSTLRGSVSLGRDHGNGDDGGDEDDDGYQPIDPW